MNVDVRTMYIAMAATCFIVAMALFISHAGRFRRDGTLSWTVGCVFQGAFWTLVGLRGVIWDFVSIVVANTFLAASLSLLYAAVREFQGRAYNRETLLLPPVATFVFFWYFSAYVDNVSYRIIFISLLSILQIIAIVWALFRDTPIQERRSCRLTGFAFPVMAVIWFNRLLEGVTLPYGHLSVLEATTFRNASVIAALGVVILSSIGFVLMIRERAKEEMQKNEERYRTLFEESRDAIYTTSQEGEILDANRSMFNLFGCSREEMIGLKARETYVLSEDRLKFQQKIEREGFVRDYEIKLRKKDGTEMDCLLTATVRRTADGNILGYQGIIRDITERKRAEEKYRTILRTTMDGFWITDIQGRFLDVNDAYCQLIGYSRDELLTMKISDVEAVERSEETAQHIQRIIETGGGSFETRHRGKDGGTIDLEVSVNYAKIGGERLFVFLRDITERKKAEEALRESEEKYRTILEEMEEGYFETDLVGNLTFINDAGCRHLGYPRQELIGMNNRVYADSENAKKVFQAFNKAYKTGEPCRVFDYEITRKDGTKAIIEMSASFVRNSEGDPIGFRGISRHVTEHKKMEEALRQSEEKYRTILENMQEVYYEIDLAGNWIFLNEAFYEHLGYTKEELIGKKSRQYQDETTARVLYQAYTRLYRTGEPIRAVEAVWISKDGAKRTYEMSASLIRDPEGKPIGFRGVSRDITERKRMEEEREKLIHELQDALVNVKTLRGLLPICSYCKKIRDDKGYWNQIESYIRDHSDAEFSHGMCPECLKKLYPDLVD